MVFPDDTVLHSQWPSENTKASLDHRPWLPNSAGVGVSLSDHPGSGRFTEATPKDMQMPGVEYELQRHAMRCPVLVESKPAEPQACSPRKCLPGSVENIWKYCRCSAGECSKDPGHLASNRFRGVYCSRDASSVPELLDAWSTHLMTPNIPQCPRTFVCPYARWCCNTYQHLPQFCPSFDRKV